MQGMGVSDELFPSFGLSFLICEMKSSDSKERQPAGLELECGSAAGLSGLSPGSKATPDKPDGQAF